MDLQLFNACGGGAVLFIAKRKVDEIYLFRVIIVGEGRGFMTAQSKVARR